MECKDSFIFWIIKNFLRFYSIVTMLFFKCLYR